MVYHIPSNSMQPTLQKGDYVFASTFSYLGSSPERGDVIVFKRRNEIIRAKVSDNSLYVLGDNRNNSSDSRHWGELSINNVIGKAKSIWFSPESERVGDIK